MRLETLYRTFKTFKAVTELAYFLGFSIGKRREIAEIKRLERRERRLDKR